MREKFKNNNLDFLRLFAALQVLIVHCVSFVNLPVNDNLLYKLLSLFPGVPIFFFTSGFLISRSFENNPALKEYALNRALRIFPALILCTFISLMLVFACGYFSTVSISAGEFCLWIMGQITFVQFYNPEFMRSFGTGVLNGSLWTISVEIQFYIMVPFFYKVLNKYDNRRGNYLLIFVILLTLFFHLIAAYFKDSAPDSLVVKCFGVSFLPWWYMFAVGILFQRNFDLCYRILRGKGFYLLLSYLGLSYITNGFLGWKTGYYINPILFLALCSAVFSISYTKSFLSYRFLKGNDISYGIYIFHMPIINTLLYFNFQMYSYWMVIVVVLLSCTSGFLSWKFVEKPFLKLKKRPLNPR